MKNNKPDFEVYVVTDVLENCLYVGQGLRGRHKHCVSGCSHVYELNKMHFSGMEVEVHVIRDPLSKEDSLNLEKELITALRPAFNKAHGDTRSRLKCIKNEFKRKWITMHFQETGDIDEDSAESKATEFLDFVLTYPIISGGCVFPDEANIHVFYGVPVFDRVGHNLWRILPEYLAPQHDDFFRDCVLHIAEVADLTRRIKQLEDTYNHSGILCN